MEKQPLTEMKIKELLNLGNDCIAIWDKDGIIVDISLAVLDLFGASTKEEFHKRRSEFSPKYQPDGRNSSEFRTKILKQVFEHGIAEFEWMYRRLDGEYMMCDIWIQTAKYQGQTIACTFIKRRIIENNKTQKKVAANSVSDAYNRVHVMLDAVPVGCWLFNNKGIAIDVNQHAVDLFEMSSKGELNRSSVAECTPDESTAQFFYNSLTTAMTQGTFKGSVTIKTKKNRLILCAMTMTRVEYRGEHAVMMSLRETNEDFEFIRQINAERVVRQRLQSMIDSSPLGVFILDDTFKVIDCNNVVVSLFEFENKSHFADSVFRIAQSYKSLPQNENGQDGSILLQKIQEAFISGYSVCEWTTMTLSEQAIPTEFTMVRIKLEDKHCIIIYVRDLREQKEMLAKIEAAHAQEQLVNQEKARAKIAEESNRAKSRFLARMSHEIRTPITSVLGISEIQLQDPNLPLHIEESFFKIYNSSNVLLGVINDILDLSRIEAGKMPLLYEAYETASMITDVVNMNISYLDTDKVDFKLHIDKNLPSQLIGDSIRVAQILNNLLSNAFKYTTSGTVELFMSACFKCKSDEHVTLVFSVHDTGMGMTQQQLDELHLDYARFHERENRLVSGTGLGMPIVHSLVEIMDAQIDISSEVGKGTQVVVRIPQKILNVECLSTETIGNLQKFNASTHHLAKKVRFTPEPMPYGNVLVVDDIEENLYVAQGLLDFYDLNVEVCNNGHDAINKIKRGKVYDIIFMDHMMPGLNGIETMHILRDMEYTAPMVALTANATIGNAEEFVKMGFDGFISKPIHTKHLNATLNKYIRDKQPPEVIETAIKASKNRPSNQEKFSDYQNNAELVAKLKITFAKNHKNIFEHIKNALDSQDKETAHRLAHSLKGIAGLMHESVLAKIARQMESVLANGKVPTAGQMTALKDELDSVLENIKSDIKDDKTKVEAVKILDVEKMADLFDNLAALLENRNAESLGFLQEIQTIPEAAILAKQIEDFEFAAALKSLNTLRAVLDV